MVHWVVKGRSHGSFLYFCPWFCLWTDIVISVLGLPLFLSTGTCLVTYLFYIIYLCYLMINWYFFLTSRLYMMLYSLRIFVLRCTLFGLCLLVYNILRRVYFIDLIRLIIDLYDIQWSPFTSPVFFSIRNYPRPKGNPHYFAKPLSIVTTNVL